MIRFPSLGAVKLIIILRYLACQFGSNSSRAHTIKELLTVGPIVVHALALAESDIIYRTPPSRAHLTPHDFWRGARLCTALDHTALHCMASALGMARNNTATTYIILLIAKKYLLYMLWFIKHVWPHIKHYTAEPIRAKVIRQ